MVRATNSPFISEVLECPVPSKFRLPQLEPFDGLKDPQDHFNTFKTTLGLQQPPDKILCRSFPTTLKGAAREWFTKLPTSSIDSFEQLSNTFLRHFVGGQCPKRPTDHLLTIRQGEKETLRSYVKRFTRETLEVNEVDDKVQLTNFKAGLKSREFVVSLTKNPLKTMAEMLLKAQKYMNIEDALAAIKDVEKQGDIRRKEDNHRGQKNERPNRRTNDRGKRKDEKTPQTPRPLHSSPNVRDKKKYCRFHKDHGHYTKDCRDLKEQIEEFIGKGKLQKYVKNGESSRFRDDNKNQREFSPNDKDRMSQRPPNVIGEIKTITSGPSTGGSFKSLKKAYQRRILVDNGNLANIIYLSTFQQLKLDPGSEDLPETVDSLAGLFGGRLPSSYNVIIGRPTLNHWKAATSTYCLKVKFPIENSVGEVKEDQVLARECYQTVLATKENHTWMIEEKEEDKVEALEIVELVKGKTAKTTRIGTTLSPEMKTRLVQFLKEKLDVFAWSHEDMPGISSKVIQHKLSVDLEMKSV
ncbi:uncharacterized protein LOC126701998 [Quercus robur]|uniref:uncharacterized protein LOC126701998 n=1 Tax=Quercus robur TaxID=38942 RepID=UPI002163C45D|nr:uncharacterized protein LOC126701998 [Quercus robur]